MKIRYIGEPGGRFNDQPLTSGDVLDLPDGVAQDLLGTSDFEKVETKQPKKKSKQIWTNLKLRRRSNSHGNYNRSPFRA